VSLSPREGRPSVEGVTNAAVGDRVATLTVNELLESGQVIGNVVLVASELS
jgi:hypothetical protein